MNEKIDLNTDLSTIESLVKAADTTLKENQVIQIHVLDKLSENKFVLFFNGNSFFADSKLALEKGQTLLAKVKSLEPSLIFSLIDFNKATKINYVDNIFKQKLSEINITPNERNINIAKAFAEELIPLKKEYLNPFINQTNKLGLFSFDDIKNAAKSFKLNIPIELENIQKLKEIFSANSNETLKNIDNLTKSIELLKTDLQDKDWLALQKNYDVIKNILSNTAFKENESANLIFQNIQKTISVSGDSYEKQILSSLADVFLNPKKFQDNFTEIVKIIDNTITNTTKLIPQISKADIENSNTFAMLFQLKNNIINISEKLKAFSPEIQNFPAISKQILNIIQILNDASSLKNISSDNIFQDNKIQNLFEEFFSEFRTKLSNIFDSDKIDYLKMMFEKSGESFFNKEYSQIFNLFNSNDIKNYFQSVNNSPNLKEELLSLKEKLSFLLENSNVPEKIKKVINDSNNIINQIYKQQFQNMLNTSNNDFNQLNLVYVNQNDQMVELPLFFKKHKSSKEKGNYEDSFSVFFSLELSNLKYFEINILDHNNNFDITFTSEDNKVNTFFRDNMQNLLENISKHVPKSVTIKTASHKKNKKTFLNSDNSDYKNNNHLIDLIM